MRNLLIVLAATAGCSVTHPSGYDELVARGVPTALEATPLKMMGCAPWSYDLAGGGKALVSHDAGDNLLDGRFSFELDVGSVGLRCRAGESTAQLQCEEAGTGTSLSLGGEAACATLDRVALLTSPSCWSGELAFDGQRYTFAYARLEGAGAPIARVSWLDERGQPIQSYEGIVDMRVTIHRDPKRKLTARSSDTLTASALALHYWKHTHYCD